MPLLNQLNVLEDAGLLQLAALQPELEYLFRHALVQDAAYSSLLKRDRKELHLATCHVLERLYPKKVDELAATLAWHYEKAGNVERAVFYLRRAGDYARSSHANLEALAFYQTAIRLLQGLGTQRAELAQFHEDAGDLLAGGGEPEAAKEQFRQADSLLTVNDNIQRARLLRKTASLLINQSQAEAAQHTFDEAEKILGAPATDNADLWQQEWIQLQLEWCWMLYAFGRVVELESKLAQLQSVLETSGTPAQQFKYFYSRMLLGHRLHRYTSPDEDVGYAQAARAAAYQTGDLRHIALADWNLGVVLLCRSDLPAAEKHLLAALQLLEKVGDAATEVRCLTYLVVLYRRKHDVLRMNQYLPRLMKSATGTQMKEYIAAGEANAAWQAWREGRVTEAIAASQPIADIWHQSPLVYPFQWLVLWTLVAAFMQLNQWAEATTYAQRMLSPRLQAMPGELATELENGINAWQAGQTDRARQHFLAAIEGAMTQGYL